MSKNTCQICGQKPAVGTLRFDGVPCKVCALCRKNHSFRESLPGLIPCGKRSR